MKPASKPPALLSVLLLLILWVANAIADIGPAIPQAIKGKQCVADTDDMRRNHMDYLKQHRIEVLREGIRTKQYSLKECLECHVPAKGTENTAKRDHFCESCHLYVGVKLDCFECHAAQPEPLDDIATQFHPAATPAIKAVDRIDWPHPSLLMDRSAGDTTERGRVNE